ncbi:protein-L-isoaspartate(D-aspartate) O-methyltransferase [Reichenbachiella carrageenanivorans]|uniref:Protein-L-isoaspartate O-methyltransferase n=1 Tax=Reichenbachiella carrageenanivorans TaxID=2979869 RepID=A0ABY6D051_9BACT|nr:protein-L-isoaspartate(D-aspartate) O-methyltransferase [Reichenbachiella carrageenanivorans]UXX79314.1 protein-L-isoaspartate(D-aspartate) O-methyltransferase [Reichenbachiella carrageenanivorans]
MELTDSYKHKGMRRSLVRKLREKGITNERVLDAIGKIPRHWFFDEIFESHAYQDKAFPIAEGQTISQPYTVAFQTDLLEVKPGKKILEIGTGSGYQACVLVENGVDLVTIEYKEKLSLLAQQMLKYMGYSPRFIIGDGSLGYDKFAPYDGIIVTAGAPTVPKALIDQLKVGGHLVIPVGNRDQQKMLRLTKQPNGNITKEEYSNFSFVPLLGDDGWRK